jgi:hypothetical protein
MEGNHPEPRAEHDTNPVKAKSASRPSEPYRAPRLKVTSTAVAAIRSQTRTGWKDQQDFYLYGE